MIFFMSGQSQLPGPDDRLFVLLFEKVGHAIEYGVLAVLLSRALAGGGPVDRQNAIYAASLAILYALTDEYHQSFVPGRTADWTDILADGVGVVLSVGLWLRWRGAARFKQSRGQS